MINKKLFSTTISCIFVFMLIAIIFPYTTEIDTDILVWISHMRTDNITNFMIWISHVGSFSIQFWIIGLASLYFIVRKRYSVAVIIIFNALMSSTLNGILKGIFERPRPEVRMMDVGGYSFPSGHTMNNTAICGFFIYLVLCSSISKVMKGVVVTFLALLAGTIAFSRMYLAVHYPTDIIGGICGGIFVVTISIFLYKKYCT